jgi:hypothetical protein
LVSWLAKHGNRKSSDLYKRFSKDSKALTKQEFNRVAHKFKHPNLGVPCVENDYHFSYILSATEVLPQLAGVSIHPPATLDPAIAIRVPPAGTSVQANSSADTSQPSQTTVKSTDTAKSSSVATFYMEQLTDVSAHPRYMLLFGNTSYKNLKDVSGAKDAQKMKEVLGGLGFEGEAHTNTESSVIKACTKEFLGDLKMLKYPFVSLFYFSGHGCKINGQLQLFGTEAGRRASEGHSSRKKCFDLQKDYLDHLTETQGTHIVILDCCRKERSTKDEEDEEDDLKELKIPPGTFIMYATEDGNYAYGNTDKLAVSPFTKVLLRSLHLPVSIEELAKRVRLDTIQKKKGQQIPWDASSLTVNFSFVIPSK